MTPTRALVGLAVAATAGYVVIHSVGGDDPQYLGDFPSIMEQAQGQPDVIPDTVAPGPPVPDPPHYDAHPVTPEAPAAAPAGPAGPGPIGAPAPPGGGGTGGQGGYPSPGVGSPLTSPFPPLGDLLAGLPLVGSLPTFDPSQFCTENGVIIAVVPCDQIPAEPPVEVPPLP
jgi:hypothetical protein